MSEAEKLSLVPEGPNSLVAETMGLTQDARDESVSNVLKKEEHCCEIPDGIRGFWVYDDNQQRRKKNKDERTNRVRLYETGESDNRQKK